MSAANASTAASTNQTLTGGSNAGNVPFTFVQHDTSASNLISNFSINGQHEP